MRSAYNIACRQIHLPPSRSPRVASKLLRGIGQLYSAACRYSNACERTATFSAQLHRYLLWHDFPRPVAHRFRQHRGHIFCRRQHIGTFMRANVYSLAQLRIYGSMDPSTSIPCRPNKCVATHKKRGEHVSKCARSRICSYLNGELDQYHSYHQ